MDKSKQLNNLNKILEVKYNDLNQLKNEITIIQNEMNSLKKEIAKDQCKYKLDNLPESIKNNLKPYIVPDEFYIYKEYGMKVNTYCLKYKDYKFSIADRCDETSPYLYITSDKNNCTINVCNIYYKNKFIDYKSFIDNKLNDITTIIHNFNNKYNKDDKLVFGLIIFYYWIKIYYKQEKGNDNDIMESIFEKDENEDEDDYY